MMKTKINTAVEHFQAVKKTKAGVHLIDTKAPVSRVALCFKTGSRYEPVSHPGISHFMRACAGLTTQNATVFGITRKLQTYGASFNVLADRENVIYRVDALKDKLYDALQVVTDSLAEPEFRSWELVDYVSDRLKCQVANYKNNQKLVLQEALHKAAFRGGLAHSLFIPEHQISKIKKEHINKYYSEYYVTDRLNWVVMGADEKKLLSFIEFDSSIKLEDSPYMGASGATRYVGGEARLQSQFVKTMVAWVGQAPGLKDQAGSMNLRLFETMLGAHPPFTYPRVLERSLAATVAMAAPLVKASIVNISHSDVGLFGFTLHGPNEQLAVALRTALKHFKKTAKELSDEDLPTLKNILKARSLIESENHESVLTNVCNLASNGIESTERMTVDQVKASDIRDTVAKVVKGKPTLVSVGNPRYLPYLDELD